MTDWIQCFHIGILAWMEHHKKTNQMVPSIAPSRSPATRSWVSGMEGIEFENPSVIRHDGPLRALILIGEAQPALKE